MSDSKIPYDLIIIGSGPAGLTAAIYAQRYDLKTLVIGQVVGGQVAEVGLIENYPGFISANGLELSREWYEHAKKMGAEIVSDFVDSIIFRASLAKGEESREAKRFSTALRSARTVKESGFVVKTVSGKEFQSKTILLASGAEPRKLGVSGEKEFFGKGVTYCFTCDAPFFKAKTVSVVGGGDSAFVGALMLSDIAKKVYLIHRRSEFSAKPGFVKELRKKKNVEFVLNAVVKRIKGVEGVEGVEIEITEPNGHKPEAVTLSLDGVFVEIGSVPSTKLSKELDLKITQQGWVEVAPDQSTEVRGVYAAGDLTTGSNGVRQIVCAMSEGAIAAQSVFKYLKG